MAPLHKNTLAQLVERLLKVPLVSPDGFKGGTATGGSTTTVVDTARREADDYFQNTSPISRVHITSTTDGAAPVGEEAEASDWVQSTNTLTHTPAMTVAPASGDTYVILSKYSWTSLVEAINMAVDKATQNGVLVERADETTELQEDTYEYSLPDDTEWVYIFRLTQEDDDGDYPQPIPPDHYKIIRGHLVPRIHFYRSPTENLPEDHWIGETWVENFLSDGKHLRIEGLVKQPKLVYDYDICEIDPNFLVYQAAAFLHAAKIVNTASDYDNHRQQAEICQALANGFLADARVHLPANIKRVR